MLSSTGELMYGDLKGKVSLVTDGVGDIGQILCRKIVELEKNSFPHKNN